MYKIVLILSYELDKLPKHSLRSWRSLIVGPRVVWTHGSTGGAWWSRRAVWTWTSMWTWTPVWATHWRHRSLKAHQQLVNRLVKTSLKQIFLKGQFKTEVSHPNFLLHQLPGVVDLLRGAPNCEHFDVGISVGWRIPLQLDPGSRLLTDAFDRLSTYRVQKRRLTTTTPCVMDIFTC